MQCIKLTKIYIINFNDYFEFVDREQTCMHVWLELDGIVKITKKFTVIKVFES